MARHLPSSASAKRSAKPGTTWRKEPTQLPSSLGGNSAAIDTQQPSLGLEAFRNKRVRRFSELKVDPQLAGGRFCFRRELQGGGLAL